MSLTQMGASLDDECLCSIERFTSIYILCILSDSRKLYSNVYHNHELRWHTGSS